jgi:hypothetical protein
MWSKSTNRGIDRRAVPLLALFLRRSGMVARLRELQQPDNW